MSAPLPAEVPEPETCRRCGHEGHDAVRCPLVPFHRLSSVTAVAGNWSPEVRQREATSAGLSAARQVLNAAVSEADFQDQVLELATIRGWRTYHPHDSRHSASGFPDLTLVRRGRIIFAELKKAGGKLRPAQEEWLAELQAVDGVEAYVWYPAHFDSIAEVLR